MKYFILVALLFVKFQTVSAQSPIEEFLQKIEPLIIKEGFYHPDWEISKYYKFPNKTSYTMQYTKGHVATHPFSGLMTDYSAGKIFDPELNIGINAQTGVLVDLTNGKEYQLKEFIKKGDRFSPKFILP